MLKTHNRSGDKRVAVTPFPTNSTQVVANRGLAGFKQREELSKLTVVYDSADGVFKTGDTVYMYGDMSKHQLAVQVWTIEEGKPFILMPSDLILLHQTNE